MLYELRVENLLLLGRAQLRLAPGLNVLTGETGAGKTLLAHALDLLLGGRARAGIVRPGAAEAYVEGVFALTPGWEAERDELAGAELIPRDAAEVVLARRVWADGRTRAYVCGRTATIADLRELGGRLLAFYGQHEHRKLMLATAQLDVLDAFCGPEHLALRSEIAVAYERSRAARARARELGELAGARERELDLVSFELAEIEAVGPSEGESDELGLERDRLRNLEALQRAASAGVDALSAEAGGGACELLAQAARQMDPVVSADPMLAALVQRLRALLYEAQDLGGELRDYLLGMEGSPGRLDEVEARLAQIARLERKHGGTVADVLAQAEHCRRRRDTLEHADDELLAAESELAGRDDELGRLARQLRERRLETAPALAEAVCRRLAELAMPEARFQVEVRPRADGCGPRGADTVELMIAPNAGVSPGPLRDVASGGELSRVMLALLSVAHGDGGAGAIAEPLLVFDEIDAGIGGHTARAVGEHLRRLAGGRQVLCITHLPQVAALAERHFTIVKDSSSIPALTSVAELEGESIVGELVRMLGAVEGDAAASQHARQLLRAA